MRMDIENSPGALAGHKGQAARDRLGLRHFGAGAMCGNCLCCMQLRDPRRERRVTTLIAEHGSVVSWHHAASTLNAVIPIGSGGVVPNVGMTSPVSIAPVTPQPLLRSKNRSKPSLAKCPSLS
jgi:hypothetical protein